MIPTPVRPKRWRVPRRRRRARASPTRRVGGAGPIPAGRAAAAEGKGSARRARSRWWIRRRSPRTSRAPWRRSKTGGEKERAPARGGTELPRGRGAWLIVTILPQLFKTAKPTISLAQGTFRNVSRARRPLMNSRSPRTSVFSPLSRPSLLVSTSRKLGPSSRRCPPFFAAGPFDHAQGARDVLGDRLLIHQRLLCPLRFFPFSRRRSSAEIAPGAAEPRRVGRRGHGPPGVRHSPPAWGRTGSGIMGRGAGGGPDTVNGARHGPRRERRCADFRTRPPRPPEAP